MERGLYIAAAGMLAEQVRQDALANDLANVSTPGYKNDRAAQSSFADLVLANRQTGAQVGELSLGARIDALTTFLGQGALRDTGEPLDVALDGEGFIAVETSGGVRYTRNGQLVVDAGGRLVTASGAHTVLGDGGQPIQVGQADRLEISLDGRVTVAGREAGTIQVVALEGATKEGETLFAGTPGARPATTSVRQGYLEGSGVDAARAMVDMIVSLRAYEAGQRVLRTIDDTLGRAAQAGSAGQ
jgi:flagellar basal-body rod protein FlgG